jgi:hypothetical protein
MFRIMKVLSRSKQPEPLFTVTLALLAASAVNLLIFCLIS